MSVAEEFVLNVAGVDIAGKRWRNGARRVIALHGWLDNAASFDVIAPLFNADIVAIDMAGHGLSYHRSAQASYNVWEDLPDILRVADALQWTTFDIVGHSRGAIISALLATAMPERVTSAVLLDGLRPNPVQEANFSDQLGLFLREHLAPPKPSTIYNSIEKAVKVRCRAGDMSEASATRIAQRGLKPCDGGWCWRHDPRLRLPSAVKMTQANIDAVMHKLAQLPHRVFFTKDGLGAVLNAHGEFERWSGELNLELFEGQHHFHMEEPAQELAEKINALWSEQN